MNKIFYVSSLMVLAGSAMAFQISLGLRETGAAGGPNGAIGSNGGVSGGIEWVNKDAAALITDGVWHQYTWTLSTATINAFAGASANNVLDGTYGVLEHIRVLNNTATSNQITLWIDDVTNTTDAGSVNFADFEGYANNAVARFQRANFSGSSVNVAPGATAGVDGTTAFTGNKSYKFVWNHASPAVGTNWARLVTSGGGLLDPSPLVRFDSNSTISFWAKAQVVPEPATMAALGLGVAALLRRKRK